MAPKTSTPLALFLTLNVLFFTLTTATYPAGGRCPTNTLKIGACLSVLNVVNLTLGSPPVEPCCSLIQGLVALEAALCLCTVLKANVLGIYLTVPVDVTVLLNVCSKIPPSGFQCP